MFWVELLIVLIMIFWGSRKGGAFISFAGGIGLFILIFFCGAQPNEPPVTVILIIMAVVLAASAMEAAGGLELMVRAAEKILRKNPKHITIVAPVVAWLFTFMCGTGHIIYSLLPVINEVAMDSGVRPERPISSSIISSQQAIVACPISAATAALAGYMAVRNVSLATILIICVPATLIGSIAGALSVYKRGKELSEDPVYLERVKAGLIKDYKTKREKTEIKKPAVLSLIIFGIAMVVIVLFGAFEGLRPVYADGSAFSMTTGIQVFMLVAAALIVIFCRINADQVLEGSIFKSGMFACVLAFGLCWMVNCFVGAQSDFINEHMSALTNQYPWVYIIAVFVIGALTASQASTTMIMVPIGIALNLPSEIIIAGWMACCSLYFLPIASQSVAAIAFDSAGTTKIGKFILNHSYMRPGLVTTVVSVVVAYAISAAVL
ncbi:MAG: anaerobic C4-dicarboxylate transporter [Clostridiales bacterium]|nr:anaerobic C4-dicarboxylate transporter [Clostridiales bacterium]